MQGPYIVEKICITSGDMYKCCVLLFTCCVTRAVHLMTEFSSSNAKLALCRFISSEETPPLLISDDFKTFKLVDVKRYCNTKEIASDFILERCSWWEHFYQWFILTVTLSFKNVLWKAYLRVVYCISRDKKYIKFLPTNSFN